MPKRKYAGGACKKNYGCYVHKQLLFGIIIVCYDTGKTNDKEASTRKRKREREGEKKKFRRIFPTVLISVARFCIQSIQLLMMLPAHFGFVFSSIARLPIHTKLTIIAILVSIWSIQPCDTFSLFLCFFRKVDGYVISSTIKRAIYKFLHCCHKTCLYLCVRSFCSSLVFAILLVA